VKIKYSEHAAPHLRGTTAHVPPALAASLVATGFAEACPLPSRGSRGWLEARLEQAAMATGPHKDDVPSGFVAETEWGVQDCISLNGQVLIIKRTGHETFRFSEPPEDCPMTVVEKFLSLKHGPEEAAEALADAKRNHERYKKSLQGARRW
jgi:hypothetical protein